MKTKYLILVLFSILLIAGITVVTTDQVNINGLVLSKNVSEGVIEMTSDVEGVTNQLGLEDWVRVYNNTGDILTNGTAVTFNGSHTDFTPLVTKSSATSERFAIGFMGIVTEDIANGSYGFVTSRGLVRDIDTDSLLAGLPLYVSPAFGEMTTTKPVYPNLVVLVGGVQKSDASSGVVFVAPSIGLLRRLLSKNYSFTSNGVLAGVYYKAGFYESSATDANLTNASTQITFGTADIDYAAHPFIVAGGAGSVDAGVVGLTATGTKITDAGVMALGHIDTLSTDITSLILNEYAEAEKFLGTITYDLIVMSGSPTTYSLDFNYGYAKYEDFGNRDFYISDIECLWQGGATDATAFNIELLHHSSVGWTYHASAFVPGGTLLASRAIDHAGYLRVLNGVDAAWKRDNLATLIDGSGAEGIIIRVTTGANGTIQIQDLHVNVSLD